jgi:hypothetical protein
VERERLSDDGTRDPVWGPPPTAAELKAARQVGDEAVREAMRVATANALTREQAAQQVGLTPAQVTEAVAAGELLELSRDPQRRLPAWQFRNGRILRGVPRLIDAWPGTSLTLALWAVRPNVDLDGRTPAEELARRGGVERVLEVVRSLSTLAW